MKAFLSLLNSNVIQTSDILCPTLDYSSIGINSLPVKLLSIPQIDTLLSISKEDWDNYEDSWDYSRNLLVKKKKTTSPIVTLS
ncbi:hypothetical protein JRY29_16370 [Salmonella enterica subsp. enterica serovar Kentucky]|nr:hypothetical protein JRY29_16370 [Salmonella enterica subsp. enterica serovar Kentucky]